MGSAFGRVDTMNIIIDMILNHKYPCLDTHIFLIFIKMAASLGYQCEFLDPVSDDLYCKKCTLVARKLSISTCCGESFCHACLADTQKEGKPCPVCGEKDYNIVGRVNTQKRINCLQVYCSMKERGCDWSGTLEQLDIHLDPDQDNCQYVDTKCPLNCQQAIPKNKVEQHVAQHCAKRPYVCQHCNFKATYEEVVDKHLPECKYVPLQCPNLCGVTFERDFMEDHMKMCRLQEVGCEFSGVGCDGRFRREDQEEHTRQNSQKHLTLTASLAAETKEQLQQKLPEQDKKHKEEEEKLKQKIEEQEKKLKDEEKKRQRQEDKLREQEKKLGEQKKRLNGQEKKLEEEEKKRQQQERKLGEQEKKQDEQKKKLVQQEKKLEEEEKKRQQQEKKLGEQEKRQEEQEKKQDEQTKKLVQQEKKLEEEEKKRQQQERKLGEQEKKLGEQEKKQDEQKKKFVSQEKKLEEEEKKRQQQERKLEEQEKKQDEQKKNVVQQEKKLEEEEKKRQQQERKLEEQEKKQDEQKKKLVQQEKKLEEEEKKRQQQERRLGEQERKLGEQEKKLDNQNKKLKEQEKKLIDQKNERKKEEQKLKQKIEELNTVQQQKLDEHKQLLQQQFNSKLQMLEQMLKEVADKSVQNEGKLSMMSSMFNFNRRFDMKNFSREKAKDKECDWKSPAMYTHVCGYKFCIGVDANGFGADGHGKSIWMDLYSMSGEYDDQLKWPANAKFTVELINQTGGENVRYSRTLDWEKPTGKYKRVSYISQSFLEHSKLNSFLKNDTLYFYVSEVEFL